MTERRKGRWRRLGGAGAALALLLGLVLVGAASAGPVGTNAGFEDDDGNLIDNAPLFAPGPPATGDIDWNNFDPTTWTGTAPTRQSTKVFNGWQFLGLEDWQATTADSAFAGGTKQDDDCPSIVTGKAPNKDDLKRIYLASKTVSVDVDPGAGVTLEDHIFLMLAWVRIPQNTTSPSAHIGFEFNKGTATPTAACPTGSNGLVHRVAGDMLIVYDFEGGTTDVPTLTLRRWVTSGACEIASNSAPCWGVATNLTAGGFAEGKVNTTSSALDTIAPSDETLQLNEFGEAGVDLTGAGVFSANTCESFGKAYGVSRSSGNSGTAQMKDLVGPGNFSLQNCGTIIIKKRTNPRGINQNFDFTSNIAGSQLTCSADTTPASFTLNDNGNTGTGDSTGNTETCTNVPAGTYTVSEGSTPSGFAFNNFACTSSGTGTSTTPTSSTTQKTVSITIAGGGSVTCIYTNDQQLGAIKVIKNAKNKNCFAATPPAGCSSGKAPLAGAGFEIWQESNDVAGLQTTADPGPPIVPADTKVKNQQLTVISGTDSSTVASTCFENLAFGSYYVHESLAPTGYGGAADQTASVGTNTTCAGSPVEKTFENTPLSQIRVTFHSLGGAGVTTATIQCSGTPDLPGGDDTSASDLPDDTTGRLLNNLPPGTYDCRVVVDP